ncbi:polysaccharide biosynthesis tyrosine autokinase [Planctomicrobium sp. SH527]|uniref:polysaccharide biosynthesis tyrosine autokinase n=1 Tax=Planctomicrobium sp. SH527 TaxID=3448123 RepID=UPI003F5CA23B
MELRPTQNSRSDLNSFAAEAPRVRENQSDSGDSGTELNLIQAVLGHKILLVFFLAVGGGLGYLQYKDTQPIFASNARIRLIQSDPVLKIDGLQDIIASRNPIDTHLVLMKSPMIIERAIQLGRLSQLPTLKENPNSVITSGLKVMRSDDSKEILDLRYQGSNPDDCRVILNSILMAYIDYLHESHDTSSRRTLELITEAKDELSRTLADKETEYAKFRNEASLLWAGDTGKNIHADRLSGIEFQRAKIMLERTMLVSQLDSVQALIRKGENREAIFLMIDQLDRDDKDSLASSSSRSLSQQLMPLLLDEQLLLERFGPGHPKVKEIQKKIEVTRALVEPQVSALDGEYRDQRPDLLNVYLDSLKHEIVTHDRKIDQLNSLFILEEAASKRLSMEENQNRALRDDLSRSKQLFDTVLTKLQSVELTKDSGSVSAEPIVHPQTGQKVSPDLIKNLLLGGIGGLVVGGLLSVLIEMSDRSYRSPAEISRHLGIPVIGHVPESGHVRLKAAKKESSLDPSLVSIHRPNSGITESYRNIRTAIMLGMSGSHQIIQVTSANPGDGKSTLSSNLAATIAHTGKRCLLIDCDLRRARVHKLFNVPNDVGLVSVVTGKNDLAETIQSSSIANLDLLTTGPRCKSPAELLLAPEFPLMLEALRKQYDMIIVDSPPVLAVSDPVTVATAVDGVVLVTRVGRNSRGPMERVHETLMMVNANLLGVVVNGINGEHSRYGSRYSAYQGYAYQYQYGKNGAYSRYHDEVVVANESA